MAYLIEHTDTYGGEANYCWARRYVFDGTEKQAVRAGFAAIGWTGRKAKRTYMGNFMAEYRIPRLCQVVFINWIDTASHEYKNYQHIDKHGHPIETEGK